MSETTFAQHLATALGNTEQIDPPEVQPLPPKKDGEEVLGTAPPSFQALWTLGNELIKEAVTAHERRHAKLAPDEPCNCAGELEKLRDRMALLEKLRWQIVNEEFGWYDNDIPDIGVRANWEIVKTKPSSESDLLASLFGGGENGNVMIVGVTSDGMSPGGNMSELISLLTRR